MKYLASLQQRLGFTRNEARVVLFLSATFLAGLGIRWYNATQRNATPQFDYTSADSEFAERSRALASFSHSPAVGAPEARSPRRKPALDEKSINLNTASAAQLVRLPGIGSSYAERIIAYRTEHGAFRTVDELENVRGIGKKRLEQIRPFVTVGSQRQEERGKKQER